MRTSSIKSFKASDQQKKFLGNMYAASNKSKLSAGNLNQMASRFAKNEHERIKSIMVAS